MPRCSIAPLALVWLAAAWTHAQGPIVLRDVTRETGIDFVHTDGSSGRRYICENMTSGLALFDYNGDGRIDVYLPNGAPLPGSRVDELPRNRLYRNDGAWRFTDVTGEAGVGHTGYGLGAAAADYDNDGDQDLAVSNFGPNVLYRNNGDGTFTNVTQAAGVAGGDRFGAGVAFLDADGDGHLDLYAANYIVFTCDLHVPHSIMGVPSYRAPQDYQPHPDTLYRNNGDGSFTDVSAPSGVADQAGTSMGMVCLDYDDDADTDVFLCNDVMGNFLFENDGTGRFEEIGLIAGVAYNAAGTWLGSMGVDAGDYDNDGRLDLFMTDYQGEMPVLYRNSGEGYFDDVTLKARAGINAFPHVNWGTGFADFDNDGHRDLFIACGHLQDNIELRDDTTAYRVRNMVLRNAGDGRFVDVSDACGDGLLPELSSRGAGFADLDGDGDLDVVVLNSRAPPTLLRNDSANDHHWLQVRLRGTATNRDGVGARVEVVAGDLVLVDEVHAGRGYQSHYGTRLHFGLGRRRRVDRVEVRWIGGGVDVYPDVGIDRPVLLTEGEGTPTE